MVADELYQRFITNDLSPKEMNEVETYLIENGESDAIIHSSTLNYLNNLELAGKLLGDDEDLFDEIPIKEYLEKESTLKNIKAKMVLGSGVAVAAIGKLSHSYFHSAHIPGIAASFDENDDRIGATYSLYSQSINKNDDIMSKSIIGEEGMNLKDPAFILQPDNHSCALKSQQIILRDFGIDIPFEDLEQFALENNYYTENGTYMCDVGKVMESAGVPVHAAVGNTMQDLMDELSQGHRVIVGVDADELWYNDTFKDKFNNFFNDAFGHQGGNHALIVAGFEVDSNDPTKVDVVLTDPGAGDCRITYPAEQFADAWSDSNCYMVATDNPAPYQYDPISHKEVPSNFMIEQHLNEWVQEHSYELAPDNIQVPDMYSAYYSSEQINDFRDSIGLPVIEEYDTNDEISELDNNSESNNDFEDIDNGENPEDVQIDSTNIESELEEETEYTDDGESQDDDDTEDNLDQEYDDGCSNEDDILDY